MRGREPQQTRLAGAIRDARGREGQRPLARRIGVGHSTLARWETGETVPNREMVALLDTALGMQGSLLGLVGHEAWSPSGPGRTEHTYAYDHEWVGPVWVQVLPAADAGPQRLRWRWGIWERSIDVDLGPQGVVLVTRRNQTSGEGGLPPTTLVAERPVHAYWSQGPALDLPHVMDVQAGWYPFQEEVLLREAGSVLSDALAWCGRSPAELAEFLGVDLAAVEAFLAGRPMAPPSADGGRRVDRP